MEPVYLGDGLYMDYDGYQVRLYASNGIETTNEVFLEPTVIINFLKYIPNLFPKIKIEGI